jgi:hypothetical protein
MKLSGSKPSELAMDDLTGGRGPGAMTRSPALLALSSTMVSPGLMAQQTRPVIRTRRLNNVRIAVSDLARSTAFYRGCLDRRFGKAMPSHFASARVPLFCFDGRHGRNIHGVRVIHISMP